RRRARTGAPRERGVDRAPMVRAAAADGDARREEPAPHGAEDPRAPGRAARRVFMIEWSEQHELIRQTFRRFVEAEIQPNLRELEHGDTPPYAVLRKMMATFGIDQMARARVERQILREK